MSNKCRDVSCAEQKQTLRDALFPRQELAAFEFLKFYQCQNPITITQFRTNVYGTFYLTDYVQRPAPQNLSFEIYHTPYNSAVIVATRGLRQPLPAWEGRPEANPQFFRDLSTQGMPVDANTTLIQSLFYTNTTLLFGNIANEWYVIKASMSCHVTNAQLGGHWGVVLRPSGTWLCLHGIVPASAALRVVITFLLSQAYLGLALELDFHWGAPHPGEG
jgi:hypothetical protein